MVWCSSRNETHWEVGGRGAEYCCLYSNLGSVVEAGVSLYLLFEHKIRKSKSDDSTFCDKATGLTQHFIFTEYVATTGSFCRLRVVINRGTKDKVCLFIGLEIQMLLGGKVSAVIRYLSDV